jgi:hypothetical protein
MKPEDITPKQCMEAWEVFVDLFGVRGGAESGARAFMIDVAVMAKRTYDLSAHGVPVRFLNDGSGQQNPRVIALKPALRAPVDAVNEVLATIFIPRDAQCPVSQISQPTS